MDDVVWLSRYTSSGLLPTLNMEVELFMQCLNSALHLYELENNKD